MGTPDFLISLFGNTGYSCFKAVAGGRLAALTAGIIEEMNPISTDQPIANNDCETGTTAVEMV